MEKEDVQVASQSQHLNAEDAEKLPEASQGQKSNVSPVKSLLNGSQPHAAAHESPVKSQQNGGAPEWSYPLSLWLIDFPKCLFC